MASWIRALADGLADLFFPPLCVACRAPAPRHLCDACVAAMPRLLAPLCSRCGASLPPPVPAGVAPLCPACREQDAAFRLSRAYGSYTGPLRLAIHALKYRRKHAAVPALADLLAQAWDGAPELHAARVIVPVPLHPRRLRKRGFNQSELLARALSPRIGIPVRSDLLVRVRHTAPQVGLGAAQRRTHLDGAFAVGPTPLPEGPILLLDDVMTTGATLHTCARVLRDAGAADIYALTLARA